MLVSTFSAKDTKLKRIWHIAVPTLLILLLMITAMGIVCHHHDGTNAANCTLCHMAIDGALGGAAQSIYVLQGSATVSQPDTFFLRLAPSEISPRAPPARAL